jgi:phosphoribosylformimino-5-aminoimidazole carboxamide ribotide isomerase
VLVIPAIDVVRGRSRVVFWPGAAAGIGAPTDRPERIAAVFVERGAKVIHLVDVDGARAGRPVSLEAVGAVASTVAVPLQLAGGLEDPNAIRQAFAAGATRVVLSLAIADRPADLAACVEVAGDWLAIGLDPRAERLAAFPWQRSDAPTLDALLDELFAAGVRRLVIAHAADANARAALVARATAAGAEVLVAGGVTDIEGLRQARDAGIAGVIVGEALLSGALDFDAALAEAA